MSAVTTPARRLARQHNAMPEHTSGTIWAVNLDTGDVVYPVAAYAATQPALAERQRTRRAFLRIGYGRLTYVEAQRFLDVLGEGW